MKMNICVRNLSPLTSLTELHTLFDKYGVINEITISTYKLKGMIKSFGHVEMLSSKHGRAAIAGLQDKEQDGNLLMVQEK